MNFIRRIINALQEPPVTEESLREMYQSMPDPYLKKIQPSELTPMARRAYEDEMRKRATAAEGASAKATAK